MIKLVAGPVAITVIGCHNWLIPASHYIGTVRRNDSPDRDFRRRGSSRTGPFRWHCAIDRPAPAPQGSKRAAAGRPPISILRPACGIENHIEETLTSAFDIDYHDYEIVFCVADRRDPVIPLIERLMDEHPKVASRLLIGDDRISINPKLNNLVKGWHAAAMTGS